MCVAQIGNPSESANGLERGVFQILKNERAFLCVCVVLFIFLLLNCLFSYREPIKPASQQLIP